MAQWEKTVWKIEAEDKSGARPPGGPDAEPEISTDAAVSESSFLSAHRVEIATATVALSIMLCYLSWSAMGRRDEGFHPLAGPAVAVLHRQTGLVLATGSSRRDAIEKHIDLVRSTIMAHMSTIEKPIGSALEPAAGESNWEGIVEATTGTLAGADLSTVDLSDADLGGAYLRNACFDAANLEHAQLQFAHLEGASFTHTDLDHANLGSAALAGADLRGSSCAEANFSEADLHGASLARCSIGGAVFKGTDCRSADFSGVSWDNQTDFENAMMEGARNLPDGLRAFAEAGGAHFGEKDAGLP